MGLFDWFKKSKNGIDKNVINENGLNEVYSDDGYGDILLNRYYKKNGERDGLFQIYYRGKLRSEGNYTNNKQNGVYKRYSKHNSQEIEKEITYKNGEEIYFKGSRGNLWREGVMEKGSFIGDVKEYDIKSRELKSISTWESGKYYPTKRKLFYNDSSRIDGKIEKIKQEINYSGKDVESKKIFYKNGNIQSEILYSNTFRSVDIIKLFKEDGNELSVTEIINLYLNKTSLEGTLLLSELNNNKNTVDIESYPNGKMNYKSNSNVSVLLYPDGHNDPTIDFYYKEKEKERERERERERRGYKDVDKIINENLFLINYKFEEIISIKLSTKNILIEKDSSTQKLK